MDPLWAELINSDWHDYLGHGRDEDRLNKPAWLAEFLSRWHFACEYSCCNCYGICT